MMQVVYCMLCTAVATRFMQIRPNLRTAPAPRALIIKLEHSIVVCVSLGPS